MKKLRLGVALLGALALAACVFPGCNSVVSTAIDDADAGDTGTVPPLDAAVDTSRSDAGADASTDSGVDASTDSGVDASTDSGVDASADSGADASTDASADAADATPAACGAGGGRLCALGEACVLDGDCASPNVCEGRVCAAEPAVRTMADVGALASFDFEGTTLVYTVGDASVYTCTLPGCADAAAVPNITLSTMTGRPFPVSVAGGFIQYPTAAVVGSTYTVAASRSLDGATAGPSSTFACADRLARPSNPLIRSSHSGADGWSGLYKCITDDRLSGGFRYGFSTPLAGSVRTDRVGRGSPSKHSNGDATVRLVPGTQTVMPTGVVATRTDLVSTVVGTIFWGNSENPPPPTELVTSPKSFGGVDLVYPQVAVRQGANFGVIRASAPGRVFTLGSGATTISIDERYLYVGKATGLGRCELSEIATLDTCTLAPLSTGEPVQAPLYLTATHAWYKSGNLVRRVAK
ncbi:MAG TPA: hypothetical protein PLR99_06450 [Polyangiaceae bacterium]|nr:hypothetical protein [Polyangiaceae bacterium]